MISKAKLVISKKKLINNYKKLEDVSDIVCYSIKTNPYVTEYIEKNTNCCFLAHHINEIKYIKDTNKIWFMLHGPDKQELSLVLEKTNNFIVDNVVDLDLLIDFVKEKNKSINLLLRMKIKEYTINTGRYFVFGMSSDQVNKHIKDLSKNKHINKIGVHFHRKTQNVGEWSLVREIKDALSEETLNNIDILDIGGGIPVVYKNLSQITIENVYNQIKKLKEDINKKNIKLMIEPGRAICASAGKLVTNIKTIVDNNIFVDASVFNYLDLIENIVKFVVEDEKEKGTAYVIKGLTPASEDIFRYRVYLDNPKVGDKVVFLNAGAYVFKTDLFGLGLMPIDFVDDM